MRLFTKRQKAQIMRRQGGRCAECGEYLPESWDAHHKIRHADGGVTELYNAEALCPQCHINKHRNSSMKIKLREWQQEAFELAKKEDKFLLNATPGAGKTVFSGALAAYWIDRGLVDFIVVVAPNINIKSAFAESWWGSCGVETSSRYSSFGATYPKGFKAAAITYQKLVTEAETILMWVRNGAKIGFVFDEVHHAGESNKWGTAVNQCAANAVRVLSMSGTPFRSDNTEIAFLNYRDGVAVADYTYDYLSAVENKVCRIVQFKPIDADATYACNGEVETVRVSKTDDENQGKTAATIFSKNSPYIEKMIVDANNALQDYKYANRVGGDKYHPAVLVVCRTGKDEDDLRYVNSVASVIKKVTGKQPVVVTSDDPESADKIDRFKTSNDEWIVAIRQVSEGVDIKRLRVAVVAANIGTKLLFTQIVGRVLRQTGNRCSQYADVMIPMFPQMVQWAQEIRDSIAPLVNKKELSEDGDSGETRSDSEPTVFMPISATYEPSGMIVNGDVYQQDELAMAQRFRIDTPQLAHLSDSDIIAVMRLNGMAVERQEVEINPTERKHEIRAEINKIVQQIGAKETEKLGTKQYGLVWRRYGFTDILKGQPLEKFVENHDLETVENALLKVIELEHRYYATR